MKSIVYQFNYSELDVPILKQDGICLSIKDVESKYILLIFNGWSSFSQERGVNLSQISSIYMVFKFKKCTSSAYRKSKFHRFYNIVMTKHLPIPTGFLI